jgi:excisionase family DNA binding protein
MATIQLAKEVMSRKEAAAYIGVGKSTLDRLAIPKIQIRRRILFRKDAIDKWLLSQQTKTTTGTKA